MKEETIFGKILNGDIPCQEIYSDEICLAFKDIEPQAPVHILIIPRKEITSLKETTIKDKEILGHLLLIAAKTAAIAGLKDWRTIINTGSEAGQSVFHLHLHVIGGRRLEWPPG